MTYVMVISSLDDHHHCHNMDAKCWCVPLTRNVYFHKNVTYTPFRTEPMYFRNYSGSLRNNENRSDHFPLESCLYNMETNLCKYI